jgi:hypothetical protein
MISPSKFQINRLQIDSFNSLFFDWDWSQLRNLMEVGKINLEKTRSITVRGIRRIRDFSILNTSLSDPVIVMIFFLTIGIVFKLSFILTTKYPLNDGGLFYSIIRELQNNHFSLPFYTHYNQDLIPFVYPPFSFYLGGLLDQFSFLTLLDILRFVPFVFNVFTGLGIFVLARRLGLSKMTATFSMGAFLLLPESSGWLIMGGGLTRSVGLFFALCTVISVHRLYEQLNIKHLIIAAFFASLVCLTHLEMAWLAFFSCILIFLFYGRNWRSILYSSGLLLIVLILTSPWWVTILNRFGFDPFINAIRGNRFDFDFQPGGGLLRLFTRPTNELFFPIFGVLAIIGMVISLLRKSFFLPIWTLAIFILQPRGDFSKAILPLSILISIGIFQGVALIIRSHSIQDNRWSRLFTALIFSFGLFYAMFSSWMSNRFSLESLTENDIQAMSWVMDNTPVTSKFLVVPLRAWSYDLSSEWFPVISQRNSVATAQGYEFVADNDFPLRLRISEDAHNCYLEGDVQCLINLTREYQINFDYIYLPLDHRLDESGAIDEVKIRQRFIQALENNSQFTRIFEGKGALIYYKVRN